jgi:hypothetical protein
MNEFMITEDELNALARYLEQKPLGESIELYMMLKNIEETRQTSGAKDHNAYE